MQPQDKTISYLRIASIIVSVLLFFLYYQGTSGPFLYDDTASLSMLGLESGINSFDAAIRFVFGSETGPLGRPVALLSFLFNAQNWPADPYWFKLTNIIIHFLTGILVYLFLNRLLPKLDRSLTGTPLEVLSIVITLAWLAHPLNVSTTLYVIQRMTQLAALFSILGCLQYLVYRDKLAQAEKISAFILPSILLFISISLAVFSKETGLLIFPMLLVIDRFISEEGKVSKLFQVWKHLLLSLPLLVIIYAFTIRIIGSESIYLFKGFTLEERAITQIYVIIDYLSQLILPNHYRMTLFHDDLPIFANLLAPQVLISLLVLIGLVTGLFLKINKLYKFAIAWFLIWHMLESTLLPLYMYFEHRNYIPGIGILVGVFYFIYTMSLKAKDDQGPKAFGIAAAMIISIFTFQLWQLTAIWKTENGLYMHWIEHHEKSKSTAMQLVTSFSKRGDARLAITLSDLALQVEANQDDLALNLQNLTLKCLTKQSTTQQLANTLRATAEAKNYTQDVLPALTDWSKSNIAGDCLEKDKASLNQVFTNIKTNAPQKINRHWLSSIHSWHATILLAQGNFEPAINEFESAFNLSPNPDTIIAVIDLNIMTGSIEQARDWLDKAVDFNQRKNPNQRDIAEDIVLLREKLSSFPNPENDS